MIHVVVLNISCSGQNCCCHAKSEFLILKHHLSCAFCLCCVQVKSSEFHVYERNLYEMPQRVPLSNGVLDRRLVRHSNCCHFYELDLPKCALGKDHIPICTSAYTSLAEMKSSIKVEPDLCIRFRARDPDVN